MAGQRSAAGRVVRRPGDLARRGAGLELVPPPLGGDHGHGGSFRRVLPEGCSILAHEPLDGRRIVVLALRSAERGDRRSLEETPERAFFYDVQTGRAEPYAALDSLTARAARIVGR